MSAGHPNPQNAPTGPATSNPARPPVSVEPLESRVLMSAVVGSDPGGAVAAAAERFEHGLVKQVHAHLKQADDAGFQQRVAAKQDAFAAWAEGHGGTYAPVDFSKLLLEASAPAVTATAPTPAEVDLTWTTVPGAASYKVERSADRGRTWELATTTGATSYADAGLSGDAKATFAYRVTGVGADDATTSMPSRTVRINPAKASAAASRKLEAAVAKMHRFQLKLMAEVRANADRMDDPAFQDHIYLEQVRFAAKVAKAGLTYTPVPLSELSVGAVVTPAAPTLTATAASASEVGLTWTATASAVAYKLERSDNGGGAWAVVAFTATPAYSNVGLAAGTAYQYRVTSILATVSSPASTVAGATTPLAAPAGLTATASSGTNVNLAWTARAGATGYRIERSTNNTTWALLAAGAGLNGASTSLADSTAATGSTYYYRIAAVSAAGNSATSGVVSATTFAATPTLAATVASATEVDLSWTSSPSAYAYKLERSANAGSTWATLATTPLAYYENTGLTADSAYQYRVSALNAAGASPLSTVAGVTTFLTAPTGFGATPSATLAKVDLAWTAVANATTYTIERSTDQATWTTLAPSPALDNTSVAYADTTAVNGVTYAYRISAVNANGSSAPAAVVTATVLPAVPTLTATVASATEVDLSWPAVTGAATYLVETSTDAGTTWTTLATQAGVTYADTGLTADTDHQYRVSATNATATSATSSVRSVTTDLPAPAGFTVTPSPTAVSVALAWTAVTDATTYTIERSTDNATWAALVPATPLVQADATYTDTTAAAATTYYYRISAVGAGGPSDVSTSGAVLTVPAATTVTATVASASRVDLSWTAVTGATNYRVQTSTDGGTTWSTLATQSTLAYADTGLTADSAHKYRVYALNATGASPVSNVPNVTTLLPAPSGFSATPSASALQVALAWTADTDATTYVLERSADNTNWTTLTPGTPLVGTDATYTDAGLSDGSTYYYRMSGVNALGTSATTAAATVLTRPAAPTVTAAAASATAVGLSWAAVPTATSYVVEMSSDGGTNWNTLATQAGVTYADTGRAADTAYDYRVSAVNATGAMVSSTANVTTLLAAPAGVTAVPSATLLQVDVGWTVVTNALSYTIERSTDNTTWTTLSPNPALTGSDATYTDATVSAGGTYYYRVSAVNSNGTSAPGAAASTALVRPATPVLTAAAASATAVNLTWPAVAGAATYLVETSADAGTTWSTLGSPSTNSYANTGLTPDTAYSYRVTSVNATASSAASSVAGVTTLLPTPTGFSATVVSATRVDLAWSTVTHGLGYKIERSTDGTTWATLAPSPALTGASTSYSDTTVSAVTAYYYRISAQNFYGDSAPTAAAQVTTKPVAPTLTATVVSATQVNLAWNAVANATGYTLQQSTDGGTNWTTISSANVTTFNNTGLTADTSYKYRISTVTAGGTSAPSTVATVTTMLAPANLAATQAVGGTQIDLTWTAVANATTYKIERSADNTTWTTLTPSPALNGSSTSYSNTLLTANTVYYYRISATNAVGTSAPSTALRTATRAPAPVLTATVASATTVNLSWPAVTNANTYKVERSADNGSTWTTLGTPSTTTYAATGLTADTSYKFRVSATNYGGTGAPSNVTTVTTMLAPPTNPAAAINSSTQIDLTWTAVANATTYKIERSTDQTSWTVLSPSPALIGNSAAYGVTGLTANTRYYFRISATNGVGTSAPGTVVNAATKPVAPATLTAATASASRVNLTWSAVTGATSYRLDSSTDGGSTWSAVVTQSGTTYANTGLTDDTDYTYRVSTITALGTSAPSATALATTLLAPPTGFTLTAASATEIDLAWNAVADATTYKIERSADGNTWATLNPADPLVGGDTDYADTTLVAGTTYYYRISSINDLGTSAATAAAHTTTLPPAPALTATTASAGRINLSWTAVTGATAYTLQSSSDGGTTWSTISSANVTSYANTGLPADTARAYRVSVTTGSGTSAYSTVKTASTALTAPTGLSATTVSAGEIDLSWNTVTHATTYKIERSTDNSTWAVVAPAGPITGSTGDYQDFTVAGGTTYYYRVSAVNDAGASAPSSTVTGLTPPAVPTVTATVASATQINLTWTNTPTAVAYKVERAPNGSSTWAVIASPVTNAFSDTGLTADTGYKYRVSAINSVGASAPSAVVGAVTLLPSPTNVAAAPVATTQVAITWNAVADATSYRVERSANNSTWAALVPSPALTGASTRYVDATVTAGSAFYYRVSAVNSAGASAPATAVYAVTPLAAPTGMTATVLSTTQIKLTWPAVSAVSLLNYKLQRSLDGKTWSTTVATPAVGTLTYTDTGLTSRKVYYYRLIVVNPAGDSAPGSTVTATTK